MTSDETQAPASSVPPVPEGAGVPPEPPLPEGPTGSPASPEPAGSGRGGAAKTLIRGTSWSTASQVLPLVINLAMTPWVIHGLGAGRYSVFLLITTIVALLGNLDGGIGQSALRFFTIYAGRDDRISTTRLLFSVSALVLGGGLLVSVVVLPFTPQILSFFRLADDLRGEATVLLFVLVPVTAFLLLRNLYSSVVYARQRFGTMSVAVLAGYLAYTVGLVLTVVQGWGLYGIAGALVAQAVVLGAISVPVGISYLDKAGMTLMSRAEFGEFFRYAWRVQVSGLISFVGQQKDQLVAGRVLSAQESGPFGQGTSFATQLAWMPQNAVGPIQAMIGQRVGANGADASVSAVESVQRAWVKGVTGWCAVGAPAAYFGVRAWLPDSFALAGTVAAILLLGSMFWLASRVLLLWGLTLGHSELEMRGQIVSLVANIALSVAFGFAFGMIGIVVATALSKLVAMIYVSWAARRLLPTQIRWFALDVPWLAAAVGFAACAVVEYFAAPFFPRGALGLVCAGFVATVPFALYAVLALRPSEWRQVWRAVRRR